MPIRDRIEPKPEIAVLVETHESVVIQRSTGILAVADPHVAVLRGGKTLKVTAGIEAAKDTPLIVKYDRRVTCPSTVPPGHDPSVRSHATDELRSDGSTDVLEVENGPSLSLEHVDPISETRRLIHRTQTSQDDRLAGKRRVQRRDELTLSEDFGEHRHRNCFDDPVHR
jgi:hypothetical protein